MSSNDKPSTSITNLINFQDAIITADNFHTGSGSNFNNPSSSRNPKLKSRPSVQDQECKEFRKYLKEKAEINCFIEGVTFVQNDQRFVDYVPLQMTQYTVKDEDFLIEGQQTPDLQPSGNLRLENLFQKSQEFSKNSPQYKAAETKRAKENCLNQLSRTVCVIAPAGMGKTCLAKQALKLVVNKKLKADYIFYLKFRDINYRSETNLLTFLTGDKRYEQLDQQRISHIINTISKNKKTFLILDGLDESTLTFKNQTPINPHEKANAETYILGLLSGDIFPCARILLTSRPFKLLNMPKEYRPYYIVQLTGISETSQRQICKDICGASATVVFNHIQNYTKLSNFCYIPLMCVLIMYCLFKTNKANQNSNLPTTLTEIFILLILLYIEDKTHSRGNINLKNLCTLAWNGISNRKLFFDNNDMELAGLQHIEKNDFTITIECKVNKNNFSLLTHNSTQFTYFSHLSIEEFFVAMHVVFFEENLNEFEKLFSRDHDLNLHETNYDMFALFIFGLFNQSTFSQYFSHDFPVNFNLDLYKQKVMMTKQFLLKIYPTYKNDPFPTELTEASLKTMDWLYQFNDVAATLEFADLLTKSIIIYTSEILPNYFLPLNYLLRHRREEIVIDDLFCSDGGERFVEELGLTMDKNFNVKLKRLRLATEITDKKISSFAICLRKVEKRIVVVSGFASYKAGLKFKDSIIQRRTSVRTINTN